MCYHAQRNLTDFKVLLGGILTVKGGKDRVNLCFEKELRRTKLPHEMETSVAFLADDIGRRRERPAKEGS